MCEGNVTLMLLGGQGYVTWGAVVQFSQYIVLSSMITDSAFGSPGGTRTVSK